MQLPPIERYGMQDAEHALRAIGYTSHDYYPMRDGRTVLLAGSWDSRSWAVYIWDGRTLERVHRSRHMRRAERIYGRVV